jgi:hypothetical protein
MWIAETGDCDGHCRDQDRHRTARRAGVPARTAGIGVARSRLRPPADLDPGPPLVDGVPELLESPAVRPGDPLALVVVPSQSYDTALLSRVVGVNHYEERLLALLMSLDNPNVRIVFCSSLPIPPEVVDHYLGLIPGVPLAASRPRVTLVSCHDASMRPLTEKLLSSRACLETIRSVTKRVDVTGLVCATTTDLEGRLSAELGVPLLGNPPEKGFLGSKSSSREVFREAGVPLPDGFEGLRDMDQVAEALEALRARRAGLQRAVVKLDEGFSGEGNAVFDYRVADGDPIAGSLPRALRYQAPDESLESYSARFQAMGGIVEELLPDVTASPSGQAYIRSSTEVRLLSTHDQVLDGPDLQRFHGSHFPAAPRYRQQIQASTLAVGHSLAARGARGRFSVDFVESRAVIHAIEVNLRRGGTTHPQYTLAKVTNGTYDVGSANLVSSRGRAKAYYSTDNLQSRAYVGLRPGELLHHATAAGFTYDAAEERGCIFHMLGSLPEFGKVGVTCIADTRREALEDFDALVASIDEFSRR